MEFLRVGIQYYIAKDRIAGIFRADGALAKRQIELAEANNRLIDATGKQPRRSMLILESGLTVISPISATHLRNKLEPGKHEAESNQRPEYAIIDESDLDELYYYGRKH